MRSIRILLDRKVKEGTDKRTEMRAGTPTRASRTDQHSRSRFMALPFVGTAMVSTVLVPIDDSERSSKALEYAFEVHPDATITALYVVDPRKFYAGTGIEGSIATDYERIKENYEQQARSLLEEASETAAERGVELETEWVTGAVARSIVDYATDHDVDGIVMGSHGRSGASRILLGSVAEAVTRRSPVPVTIVR